MDLEIFSTSVESMSFSFEFDFELSHKDIQGPGNWVKSSISFFILLKHADNN